MWFLVVFTVWPRLFRFDRCLLANVFVAIGIGGKDHEQSPVPNKLGTMRGHGLPIQDGIVHAKDPQNASGGIVGGIVGVGVAPASRSDERCESTSVRVFVWRKQGQDEKDPG